MAVQVIKNDFRELGLTPQLLNDARSRADGKDPETLSQMLEKLDPSINYDRQDQFGKMDAFERQLYACGIRTISDHTRGMVCSKVGAFFDKGRKEGANVLFPEFINRVWRAVSNGGAMPAAGLQQRFYLSSAPVSDVLYPEFISEIVRQKQIAPTLPLSLMVAVTTPIDSGVYDAFRLTDDEDERTMRRVAEGTEVPTAILTGSDVSIRPKKYGRQLKGTYETFRRMAIDRFALHLALLAAEAEVDKVETAIDVLVNGDGNAGTAATNTNISTIQTGWVAGDNINAEGYLRWRMLWTNPYVNNVIIATVANSVDVMFVNVGSANVVLGQLTGVFGVGGIQLVGPQAGPVQLGWDSTAPANALLGFDNRFALEMVTEIGSEITETDKLITAQFNIIVMTENIAFAIWDTHVTRTVTLNA